MSTSVGAFAISVLVIMTAIALLPVTRSTPYSSHQCNPAVVYHHDQVTEWRQRTCLLKHVCFDSNTSEFIYFSDPSFNGSFYDVDGNLAGAPRPLASTGTVGMGDWR